MAAAIHSSCDRIVTWNLADFPNSTLEVHGLKAQTPDNFLSELMRNFPKDTIDSLKRQRANLGSPPLTVERFIENLSKQNLPKFVEAIKTFKDDF